MRVNPFRRSRHARRWWQTPPTPVANVDAVTEPIPTRTESVEIVADFSEFARAIRMLDAGVSAHRQPQPDRAHLDRHGPFLPASAVVPPPAMPGGAG